MSELWIEKYRPKSISDYVFTDPNQKAQIESWVKEGNTPQLLLSGPAGVGKTTLAKVLFNELNIHEFDIKMINASSHNGVDYIRDTVENFCSSMPFGEFKYVLLDEADGLSPSAQATLRGVMEKYSNSVRFILTMNYPHKIIPALHSRCQGFHIDKLDKKEFTARLATILLTEEIDFDIETLDAFVAVRYPDLRKAINDCQQHSQTGKLIVPEKSNGNTSDYQLEMVKLFREGKYKQARTLICQQINQEEYEDMFRFMYQNLDIWSGGDEAKENEAIVTIRNGLVKHTTCADSEINLSATFIELELIANG